MDAVVYWAALAATAAGSCCLYLGAPRQQWLARPWPPAPARAGGGLLLAVGWLGWTVAVHPATALFMTLVVAMLVLSAVPAVAALTRARRGGAA